MIIDEKLVEYVAKLSRIKLTPEEEKMYVSQLKDIVQYVEKLSELKVDDVLPMDHVLDVKNVYREDRAQASFPREDILKNAPSTDGSYFKVPKIL
jgi:aspartyl-tRNA(Asn)/glutamyl-tRNA(Gln) amidotransferase subunit C